MIVQNIRLRGWGWSIAVFYDVTPREADAVLLSLELAGCRPRSLRRAERNLRSGECDTGLTYTNPDIRQTIMVIGKASSPEQFWNTLDHEKGHAVMHIVDAIGIDHESEDYQYLAGDLSQQLHSVAKMFICEQCSN